MTGPAEPVASQSSWTLPEGTPTRLVLVRHGSTEHSPKRLFSGRNQLPLSDLGRQQAQALATRFAQLSGAVILTSPLPRTRQTAEAIGAHIGVAADDLDDLVETDFGAWEGLSTPDVRERWPRDYAAFVSSSDGTPPGGESFDDVLVRVRRAVADILDRYAGRTVLVVTHVTPIKTALRMALQAPFETMFRIHLDTASVSIVDYFENGAASVRLVNDTSHLSHLG